MPDLAAFLATIRDHPADDGPRLVFADWLEEQGDTARAELIRVQCERRRLMAAGRLGRELHALDGRASAIWGRYADEWFGPLRNRGMDVVFDRGTLAVGIPGRLRRFRRMAASALGIRAFDRLLHHPAFRESWTWVTRLTLRDADEMLVADLARSPALAGIVELTIDRLGPGGAAVLAESAHATSLRVLTLNRCRVGPDGAVALAVSPRMAGLTELHLRHARVGDRGARAVAESPFLANLRVLKLNDNDIGRPGGEALAGSQHLTRLARLHLRGNPLPADVIEALRERYGAALSLGEW